jgi:hypothetical protein
MTRVHNPYGDGRACERIAGILGAQEGLRRAPAEDRAKLKWLRGAVQEGLDEIRRGEGLGFRSTDELDRHIDQLGEDLKRHLPDDYLRSPGRPVRDKE